MKKQSILITLLLFSLAPIAQADEGGLSLSGDIGAFSQYIWRGAPQTTDKVAVQGDLSISTDIGPGTLSASAWGSNTFASPAPQFAGRDAIEFDYTLDYSGSVDAFGLGYTFGSIYYTYLRDSTANFVEIYGGLSLDTFISPSVTLYYTVTDSSKTVNNLNETGDLWIDAALSTTYLGIDMSAMVSFVFYDTDPTRTGDAALGQFDDGASVITIGLSKDFAVKDVTITPSLSIYIPIASKALDGKRYIYNTVSNNDVVLGLNVAF